VIILINCPYFWFLFKQYARLIALKIKHKDIREVVLLAEESKFRGVP